MACQKLLLLYALLLLPLVSAATVPWQASQLGVDIVGDDGRLFPIYEIAGSGGVTHRAWLEALDGHNYAIRIYNNSERRVGLVIAVDGRNIISGQKSTLASTERMYILDPWQSATYEGWRTSNRQVNQFFFTDAEDSYTGAWQDYSAMGVIAVAAFNEKPQYRRQLKSRAPYPQGRMDIPAEAGANESAAADRVYKDEKNSQAGTGFGEEKYSFARQVEFRPMSAPVARYFYKYEWRETLCQKGIIDCRPYPPNRFWPEPAENYGYVPYPPS